VSDVATSSAAAATGDRTLGYLIVAAAVVMWVVGYAVACALWPFADCTRCKGSGKKRSPSGRAFRRCRKCKGSGRRVRTGRRVFVWLSVLKDDAT